VYASTLVGSLIASALLVAAAIRNPHFRFCPWLGLVPLYVAVRALRPVGAAVCGAVWGSYVVLGVAWYTGAIPSMAPWILVAILIPAGYAAAASAWTGRFGYRPLLFGAAWLVPEALVQLSSGATGLLGRTVLHGPLGVASQLFGWMLLAGLLAWIDAEIAAWLGRAWNRIPAHLRAPARDLDPLPHRTLPVRASPGRPNARSRAPPRSWMEPEEGSFRTQPRVCSVEQG
jgi:hypothetical protein